MKKFISLMLLFAFASFTWAQDEEEDEEEEEEVVEVVKPKKAAKPAVKAGNSRLGVQAGFSEGSEFLMGVYDFGTGLRLNIGLDAQQYTSQVTSGSGAETRVETTTKTAVALAAGLDYELGKQLLPFGIGAMISLSNEPTNDQPKYIALNPYFYVDAELVKNLAVTIKPGVAYYKPDGGDATISLGTSVAMTFFFM